VVWGGTDLVPAVWYRELDLATGEIGAATMLNDPLIPTSNPAMLVALDRIFVGVEQEESGLKLVVVIQAADIDRISQRDSEPFRRRVVTMTLSVGRIGLQLFIQAGTARALWLENPDEIGYSDYLQTIDNWANAYYLTNSPSGAPAP
jgi:hypothetical protein